MKGLALWCLAASLVGCGGSRMDDGVPRPADPAHPTDENGKPMATIAFLKKYCHGAGPNGPVPLFSKGAATCNNVARASAMEALHAPPLKGY